MLSSVASAALIFSITLALVGAVTAAYIIGGAAVIWECYLFYRSGLR